jgi:hypothetical protein
VLDLGDAAVLTAPALADHDQDGTIETSAEELTGLAGQQVTLGVDRGTDPAVVRAVNGAPYR